MGIILRPPKNKGLISLKLHFITFSELTGRNQMTGLALREMTFISSLTRTCIKLAIWLLINVISRTRLIHMPKNPSTRGAERDNTAFQKLFRINGPTPQDPTCSSGQTEWIPRQSVEAYNPHRINTSYLALHELLPGYIIHSQTRAPCYRCMPWNVKFFWSNHPCFPWSMIAGWSISSEGQVTFSREERDCVELPRPDRFILNSLNLWDTAGLSIQRGRG